MLNSCFAPFRLTNVYALCQRLMTLIIMINRSSVIKTSRFSLWNKFCSDTWMFIELERLPSGPLPSNEINGNSIRNTFDSLNERNAVFIVHRHCRPRNETLAPHRSEIAHFAYLRKVCRIMSTSRETRMPISYQSRRESEPWNSHFFIHPACRISFWAELSEFDRLLYHVDSL